VSLNDTSIEKKLNIAIENQKNKNFKLAEKLYKEILTLNPDHTEAIFHLGTLYSQIKKFSLAKPLLLRADGSNPNNLNIKLNIGSLLFNTGEVDLALKYFDKAIEIQPNFILAYFNKGIILNSQKKYQDAVKCFEKVIEIDPKNINAYNVLGIILQEIGEFRKSLSYLKKSIEISPNDLRVVNTLLNLLRSIKLSNLSDKNSSELVELFIFLFNKDTIDHNELFNNARNLIFFQDDQINFENLFKSGVSLLSDKDIKKILNKKLFHLLLQKSLVRDKFLEKFLYLIRKEILLQIHNKENSIKELYDFIASNAEQSFLNEYVVFQSDMEIKIINDLKTKVENDKTINELEILILACYLPLNSSKIINNKLINYISESPLFNDLIKLHIKDPLKEAELKKSINSFDDISDNVSKKVKEQYEENPYPRWRYTNITPKNNFLSILNNAIRPNKINTNNQNIAENVLIAGCGTGQQLVSKTSYANSNIVAIDLSLSSLAFAKRKMQELDQKNIEFLQGDILGLNSLNKKFNVIECVGVLHHLKNPDEGLRILLNILEPKGYLKLGLYSEYARKHIIELKNFVQKHKFESNVRDIRNFRELAKNNNNDNSFKKINFNFDFYSTSSLRDLIFHVQEHRYTIPKIQDLLKKFDLEFLGFTNSSIKKEYSKIYPEDLKNTSLENWNNFEINNQDIFIEMYQFWVKKND
tara:strand:- start:261 stop:2357 length:2097 start_codon:yes stop_codon:yes gene_type:complete